jgi:hypothetical protein
MRRWARGGLLAALGAGLFFAGLTACVAELVPPGDASAPASASVPALSRGPLIGGVTSGDHAERGCQIVLRDAGRVVAGEGFATVPGQSAWLFDARVDVSHDALVAGFTPFLLVQAGSDPAWRALLPMASVAIAGDTERFLFEITEGNLPGPGMSGTGLSRAKVALIPFLAGGDARLFDHNRLEHVLASYELVAQNSFAIKDDPAICAPPPGPAVEDPARPDAPTWMGNATAVVSRAASVRCEGASPFGSSLVFAPWARQRAAVTDLCFEAYKEGVTDFDNPAMWQQLDASATVRFAGAEGATTLPIPIIGRVGNNAHYAVDLRALDPFRWGRCLDGVPTTTFEENGQPMLLATAELVLRVNGRALRHAEGAGGEVFVVRYSDYKDAPRVGCD